MLNAKEYIEKGGNSCPFCGSTAIDGNGVEIEKGKAFQPCSCNRCGKEWTDIYILVGFSHPNQKDGYDEVLEDPKDRISSLEERVRLLREALGFYANAAHWQEGAEISHDGGDVAREALDATKDP
jgi:hypothetical protein